MSREYRFTFTENINLATAFEFEKKVCEIIGEKDFSKLTILFSSDGGSTDLGLSLHNFIKQLPQAIHMHAIGHVGSSAIPVFLAANQRTAEPNSRFFFHAYGWDFGGGYQYLHTLNEAVQRLNSDILLHGEIIKARTNIDFDILPILKGEKTSVCMTAQEAVAYGLVNEIICLKEDPGSSIKYEV